MTWLVVWLVVGAVAAAALIACLVGLVRHVLVLGRTVRGLQHEISPIAQELARGTARASERSSSLRPPGRGSARGRR